MLPFPSPIITQQQQRQSPWEQYLPQFLGQMLMNKIQHQQKVDIAELALKKEELEQKALLERQKEMALFKGESAEQKETTKTAEEYKDIRKEGFDQLDWPQRGQIAESDITSPRTLGPGMFRRGPKGEIFYRGYKPAEKASLREKETRPRELDIIGAKIGVDTSGRIPITKEQATQLVDEITKIKKERQANAMLQLLQMMMQGNVAMDQDMDSLVKQYDQLNRMTP